MLTVLRAWGQTVLPLWPDGKVPYALPNDTIQEQVETQGEKVRVGQVRVPTLSVYLPKTRQRTGAAVLIIPGGGYSIVAIGHEGKTVAEWYNRLGIAAFVLKYRLPDARLWQQPHEVPLQDARQAMRLIRAGAAGWGIEANKVGVMGFSAGGHLASTLCTHAAATTEETALFRPNWAVLGYPVISFGPSTHAGSRARLLGAAQQDAQQQAAYSNEKHVTAQTPPTFLFHATDDKSVPVANALYYYQALVQANVPSELHIFEKGGHGFGLGKPNDGAAGGWPALCAEWLRRSGYAR